MSRARSKRFSLDRAKSAYSVRGSVDSGGVCVGSIAFIRPESTSALRRRNSICQVRIMAGTLIDIGLGIYPPDSIPQMLAALDRRKSGSTAPAHGLYLDWIRHHESRPATDSPVDL